MLREANAENLYLITGYTDMRKGLMSLVEIVQSQYNLDPYTDSLFLFCGRNARKLKALYWDGDGFLLMSRSNHIFHGVTSFLITAKINPRFNDKRTTCTRGSLYYFQRVWMYRLR